MSEPGVHLLTKSRSGKVLPVSGEDWEGTKESSGFVFSMKPAIVGELCGLMGSGSRGKSMH